MREPEKYPYQCPMKQDEKGKGQSGIKKLVVNRYVIEICNDVFHSHSIE
jgi:hypothetical protein